MTDPFRASLQASANEETAEAARRRQVLRAERVALTFAALGHQVGRVFLTKRLADEQAAAAWQPGDTIEAVAHRAGRVALLRELLLEMAEHTTPTTPGA